MILLGQYVNHPLFSTVITPLQYLLGGGGRCLKGGGGGLGTGTAVIATSIN